MEEVVVRVGVHAVEEHVESGTGPVRLAVGHGQIVEQRAIRRAAFAQGFQQFNRGFGLARFEQRFGLAQEAAEAAHMQGKRGPVRIRPVQRLGRRGSGAGSERCGLVAECSVRPDQQPEGVRVLGAAQGLYGFEGGILGKLCAGRVHLGC